MKIKKLWRKFICFMIMHSPEYCSITTSSGTKNYKYCGRCMVNETTITFKDLEGLRWKGELTK